MTKRGTRKLSKTLAVAREWKADTLLGIFCGGNLGDTAELWAAGREKVWQGFQRIADYLNVQSRSPLVPSPDSQIVEEALRELIAAATLVINNRQMTAYSRKSADLLRKSCAQAKEAVAAIEKQRRGE